MSASVSVDLVPVEAARPAARWRVLYVVGGVAAALLAVLTVAHAVVFAVVGLPETVEQWFALFQRSPVRGLLAFEQLMVLYAIVSIPLTLALFVALRRGEPSLALLYLPLGLISAVTFVLARPGFEMLYLSSASAGASAGVRTAQVAAGEAMVATFHGTGFWVSYLVGSASGVFLGAAMLRAGLFGRAAASLRIASSVLDLGLFVPDVGLVISLGSVVCLLVFNVLVARRLVQMGRSREPAPS
jgi:hypothetical protein